MSLHTKPVSLRLVLDVTYLPNGVPTFALVNQLEAMIHRTIGNGGLTGDTPEAEVDVHSYKVVELPEPMSEEELASFMLQRIESGSLDLGEIPVKLARYGLMEPHAFVAEMRERLEHLAEGDTEPDFMSDIEGVLRSQSLRVANSEGKSFDTLAAELLSVLDEAAVDAAEDRAAEIERQLVANGTLEAPRPEVFEVIEVPIDAVYPFEVGSRVGQMFVVHDFSVTLLGAKEAAAAMRKKMPDADLAIRQFTGKGLGVTDHCPPWTPTVKGVAPVKTAFWSNAGDPPVVGATVRVTLNNLGLGIVTGYAINDGFLALMVQLKDSEGRPDWHKASNPNNEPAIVFGNEFKFV